MSCMFTQFKYLRMIYNVKLILIVYTSENVWPTVNQEGEYILNAVKAYGFFLWDFFLLPSTAAYCQAVMCQVMEKYFIIWLPVCFFFIDCERC